MSGTVEQPPSGAETAFPTLPARFLSTCSGDEKKVEAALAKFDNFVITDDTKRKHLRTVALNFDVEEPSCVMEFAFLGTDEDGKYLKKILSLGVDPDRVDRYGRTASFVAVRRPCVALLLIHCRPNLQARHGGFTLEEYAKHQGQVFKDMGNIEESQVHMKVAKYWIIRARDGHRSIARLAREQHFWAVRNLALREVVPDYEKFEPYLGKNAIEWAEFFGQTILAEELRFLLGKSSGNAEVPVESGGLNKDELMSVSVAKLKEDNRTLTEYVTYLRGEIEGLKAYEEQAKSFEEEVKSLRESVKSHKEEMKKQQESFQAQLNTVKDQLTMMPSVIASSVASTASALQTAAKRRRIDDN